MKAVGYGVWENDKLKIQFGSYSHCQLHTSDAVAEKREEVKRDENPRPNLGTASLYWDN